MKVLEFDAPTEALPTPTHEWKPDVGEPFWTMVIGDETSGLHVEGVVLSLKPLDNNKTHVELLVPDDHARRFDRKVIQPFFAEKAPQRPAGRRRG